MLKINDFGFTNQIDFVRMKKFFTSRILKSFEFSGNTYL